MRSLLAKIPRPDGSRDRWQGIDIPPVYRPLKAPATPTGQTWFVDGGNASILEAPHFSLQQLRVVGVHYPEKRVIKKEAKVLLVREREGWTVFAEDGTKTLIAEEELQEAITIARQRLEQAVAEECREQQSGIVVLDGDSAPEGTIALQKTVTTLTENGFPLSAVLTAAGPWYAKLGSVYAAKLNPRARHVFLIHNLATPDASELLGILAANSDDPLFPGYPVGLVLADRLARVSNEEREALRIHAKSMLRELSSSIETAEASSDAHRILDSM